VLKASLPAVEARLVIEREVERLRQVLAGLERVATVEQTPSRVPS
jgi:hypothetical protein